MIALYSTNDSIVHAVNVILSHLICHQTFFKANGWTSLENFRALVESYYVTTDQSEDKSESTSKSTPVVAFNQFFGQFMKCYLNLLNTKLASITIPKRTTQAGSVIFEGYAMSTVLGLNFFLSLIPDIPHSVVANPDGTPLITPYKAVKSVNDLDEPTCQMITLCLDIFNAVRPQITSINELCSIRDPTNHISLPIMANGIVPLMMRAMETETIFIMKQLFKEGGDMIEPRKKNILNRLDACEKLLYQLRVIIKEDDKQEDEQEARPKSDWMNQITMNCAVIIFTLLGFSFRISEVIRKDPLGPYLPQKEPWEMISNKLWDILRLLLIQLSPFLKDIDNVLYGSLSHLKTKKAQDLFTYPAYVPLFTHDIFKASTESMENLFVALRNDILTSDDRKILDLIKDRRSRELDEKSNPQKELYTKIMLDVVSPDVEVIAKDNLNSLLERETNGMKALQRLWRELIIGPTMWHGEASEGAEEYWQMDRRESSKRLRNRLKRDWHERPHRTINRVVAALKSAEEQNEDMNENQLMNMKLAINTDVAVGMDCGFVDDV